MTLYREIELKLDLADTHGLVPERADIQATKPNIAVQRSIYFDTPDRTLEKAGFSLRIRLAGRKRIQTVKYASSESAGFFDRKEWERPVPNDEPILDDTTPLLALLGEASSELSSIFVVTVERKTWQIAEGNAIIELAIDQGLVSLGNLQSPICEVELELQRGHAAALFLVARKLDAAAPARLSVRSKAQRGYALSEPPVTAFCAESIMLDREMTAAQAMQHVVQNCLRQFRLNEDLLLANGSPEALHQARVALSRLRSAFFCFKPLFDDRVSDSLRDSVHWLANEFGGSRSLDALLERTPPGAIWDQLSAQRAVAYAGVVQVLESPRARLLMLDLAEWALCGDWLDTAATKLVCDKPVQVYAVYALDRMRHKLKNTPKAFAKLSIRARHDVRKNVKKFGNTAEFFMSLFDRKHERKRFKHFTLAVEHLEEDLGILNDRATAPDVLKSHGVSEVPKVMAILFPENAKKLLRSASESHIALIRAPRFWRKNG